MTKVCPVCGKSFDAKPCGGGRPQRYCSTHCRNVYHCRAYKTRRRGGVVGPDGRAAGRVPIAKRTCPVCGRVFEPNPSRPKQKYCSLQCTRKAWADTLKAARLAARKDRVCPVCGVTFTPKKNTGVYCSKDCYHKAHWLQHKRELPETVKCEHCGKEFKPKNSLARFCSKTCYNKAYWQKVRSAEGKRVRSTSHLAPSPLPTFSPSAERRIREYLALPAAERWARRGTLTEAELKMAEKMWNQMHGV